MDKIVRVCLGVGVGLLVARHLGPELFGELSYALALIGILSVLAEGGLDAVLKRELLRLPEVTGRLMRAAVAIRGVSALLIYGCLLSIVYVGAVQGDYGELLLVIGVLVFQPLVLLPDLWFQARLESRISLVAQWGALAAGAAVRLGLVLIDAPFIFFAWTIVGEAMLAGILVVWRAKRAGLRLGGERCWPEVCALGREAWPLLLSGFAVGFYMRMDAVMLKHIAGEEEVGFYAAATRLSEIWYFIPVALGSSLLPSLLRAKAAGGVGYLQGIQRYFDASAACAYVLTVPLALASGPIVHFAYGEDFAEAGGILVIHTWASVFVFLGVARGQWLVNEGLSGFYLAATVVGAVINMFLNFALIPRFGGQGAACATVVSYAGAAWISSYFLSATRVVAGMQTNALLIPFRFWKYLPAR
jgi:PST family polysaccharide transporter